MLTQIETTSKKLVDAGVKAGERVAILSENSADFAILILALWKVGAVAIPLSTRYKPTQIEYALEISNAKIIFTSKSHRMVAHALDALNIEDFTKVNINQIGQLVFDDLNLDPNAYASIIFTSASTAKPKAVLHTIANHYYSALGSNKNIPFATGDAWLMSLPMYHISGFSLIMRSLINKAAIIFPKPDEQLSDAIKNPAITHISLVPAQLSKLLESAESKKLINRLQKFNAILIGGSAIPASLIKSSLEISMPIFTTYGSTEMASQITTTEPDDLKNKIDSSGKLLPHRKLKIAHDGEILVKGKTLFKGYAKNDLIELPTDSQGYFHTNDIGSIDLQGNLTVIARKDLMFISGGENIHPQQIEIEIEKIENVECAIVIPTDDKIFEQAPVAFIKIQKDHPLNPKAIQSELQKKLESFKIPKIIYPWPKEITESVKPNRKDFMKFL